MSQGAHGPSPASYDLERFVHAQNPIYSGVLQELRSGRKTGHWIWFIFPQIQGLGFSATSRRYAIGSLQEAAAYLNHATLGPRLRECTQTVLDIEGKSLAQIFGSPDDMKFRSSMTLFAHAGADEPLFQKALDKYCGSQYDPLTLERI